MKHSRLLLTIVVILTLAANLALDRVSKEWASSTLPGEPPQSIMGGVVTIVYAENTGAFLGMGADWPVLVKQVLFVWLPIIVCLIALVWAVFGQASITIAVLVATMAGGGLGNLVDRMVNNFRVVDFLHFKLGPLQSGIVNVADLSVTFAAIALLWMGIVQEQRQSKNRGTQGHEVSDPQSTSQKSDT